MSTRILIILAIIYLNSGSSKQNSMNDELGTWHKFSHLYTRLYGNSFYYMPNDKMTWFEASQFCARQDSHLAILNSPDEFKAIEKLITRADFYHIGFHDLFSEGNFVTVNCQTIKQAGYDKWLKGEPSGTAAKKKEDCGTITENGLLNDEHCFNKRQFVCEHEFRPTAYNNTYFF
ncbi:hypothetical protein L9F63_021580 [Diploptera punctata]|uniref:C-type lectin domain-containing protein n=1 Tax=Diploptera punctata TaxID=6984 RepID=A0AAD7ZNM9_DIPPU|nr:hypothetical protein L9F63_021580 [Diploptera punctata]